MFNVSNGSTNADGDVPIGAVPDAAFRTNANEVVVPVIRGASFVETIVIVFVTGVGVVELIVAEALSVTWNVASRDVPGKSPVLRNVTACINAETRAGVASAFKVICNVDAFDVAIVPITVPSKRTFAPLVAL